MSESRVAAVVVNYNAGEHLVRCVASLRAAGVEEVRIADNGSRDESLARLRASDQGATVVETGGNHGYGGGANRGARNASADYLLICNADLRVAPGAVARLARRLDDEPGVAVVGPRLENEDGSLYPSARTFPDLVDALGHAALGLVAPANRFTRRYRMLDWDHGRAADVDWVSGACLMVRREVFEALAGFDESYFMYLEDVDLCWRVWRAGWRVRYEPDATVVHAQGVSTDQTPYRMLAAHHRSMHRFAVRTTEGWRRAALPAVSAGLVARLGVAIAHRAVLGRWRRLPRPAVPGEAPAGRPGPAAANR